MASRPPRNVPATVREDATAITAQWPLNRGLTAAGLRRLADPPGPFLDGIRLDDNPSSSARDCAVIASTLLVKGGGRRSGGHAWPARCMGELTP